MGKSTKTDLSTLSRRTLKMYKKLGVNVRCDFCGKEIEVGSKYIRRGKFKPVRSKSTVKFYCGDCWTKMYLELPEPTEKEIERGEVLTVPFVNLEKVMLCRD